MQHPVNNEGIYKSYYYLQCQLMHCLGENMHTFYSNWRCVQKLGQSTC